MHRTLGEQMTTHENGTPMPDVWVCEPKQPPPWVPAPDQFEAMRKQHLEGMGTE